MSMSWERFRSLLRGRRLPAAMVDLSALDRNTERIKREVEGHGKTLRVASKSVRHVGLLRRILERGGPLFRGLMCFTHEEALFLLERGFDDLLIAYPSVQREPLVALARAAAEGARVLSVVDSMEHLRALEKAGEEGGGQIGAVVELDVSFSALCGRVHLGAMRSPLRTAEAVLRIAERADSSPTVTYAGLMGYEAHIAGLPDENPFSRALNPVRKVLKRCWRPAVAALREEVLGRLKEAGLPPPLVNGAGTGSLKSAAKEPGLSELTAGSGFLCPHLFDYYEDLDLEPAAFFALELSRIPEPGVITCLGGGYLASGEPGADRLPLPYLPEGLSYLPMEGAGEVQTPLRLPKVGIGSGRELRIGDPILFRHAKAGELAERFNRYLLFRGDEVIAEEPTYRGEGQAFL